MKEKVCAVIGHNFQGTLRVGASLHCRRVAPGTQVRLAFLRYVQTDPEPMTSNYIYRQILITCTRHGSPE